MSATKKKNKKNKNKSKITHSDAVNPSRNDDWKIRVKKARTLEGKVIRKNGVDFGEIVKIITIGNGYDFKLVAITDKDFKIDVNSIWRAIANVNGPEKFYPEGSQYSERIMRSPRRKGGGKALNGSSEIDDKSQEFVKRHYSKGYKTS